MKQTKRLTKSLLLALLLVGGLAPLPAASDQPSVLVIIIDDIGNHLESGKRAVELPGKLNFGILPYTPGSIELAQLAAATGKEVILHAPMSNLLHKPLGPGALTVAMSEQELRETLGKSLDQLPYVRGVSNHMGSQLTSMREPMQWVMEELISRQLYFIDSRTSAETLAADVAAEYGIPNLSRQVFLDNEPDFDAIDARFQELLQRADQEGIAIAIAHPYPETLDYLQHILPTLVTSRYRLALVSEILAPATQLSQAKDN